jgi:hypothetical protein
MLGFNPISSAPISAVPSIYATSGLFATGRIGTVTIKIDKSVTVTGVRGTGRVGTVSAGQGATIYVTGVKGTGVIDHACFRSWNDVDTVDC